MQREIQLTADGSHTVVIPEMNASYHSKHGAIMESRHVYIQAGLHLLVNQSARDPVNILEMGFGTGLNALLTLQEAFIHQRKICYQSVELYPLSKEETDALNYGTQLHLTKEFDQLHAAPWEKEIPITSLFTLQKFHTSLLSFSTPQHIDCIYFDAFSPVAQPELWTKEVFEKLFSFVVPGGILVTYCSKSEVRRNMTAAGFTVTKIPGPHGKRDMVRAFRSVV